MNNLKNVKRIGHRLVGNITCIKRLISKTYKELS